MKRGAVLVISVSLILLLSISFVSAGFWQDFQNRVNKKNIQLSPTESSLTLTSIKSGLIIQQEPANAFRGEKAGGYYLGGTSYDYRHYEYFDLSSIPQEARIIRATLTKYRVSSGETAKIQIKPVAEPWTENQSYNTLSRYPYTSLADGFVIRESTGDLIYDVTGIVQSMHTGNNYGFEFSRVEAYTSSRYFYFRNAPAGKQPTLEITYTLESEITITCTDTDSGLDYYTRGQIEGNIGSGYPDGNQTYIDYCLNSSNLIERYCTSDYTNFTTSYDCPSGCQDGACIEKPTCQTDSECASKVEVYCEGNAACTKTTYYTCQSGKCTIGKAGGGCSPCLTEQTCQSGKCVAIETSKYLILKDFGSILYKIGSLEKGITADGVGFVSTLFKGFINGESARYYIKSAPTSEVYAIVTEFNHKLSSQEFEENFFKKLITENPKIRYDFEQASQVCENCPGQILVYSNQETSDDASVVWTSSNKFAVLSFRGTSRFIEKDIMSMLEAYLTRHPSTLARTEASCTDTDGGLNYYMRGFMKAGADDSGHWDTCYNIDTNRGEEAASHIIEYYCENNQGKKTQPYPCEFSCQNGACIIPESECSNLRYDDICLDNENCYWDQETDACWSLEHRQLCSDPDGGKNLDMQAHTFGFRTYSSSENPERDLRIRTGGKDSCLTDKKIIEHYCEDNYYITSTAKECSGRCESGACTEETCQPRYYCEVSPQICPSSGIQIKRCQDVQCNSESYEEEISCNPGECSGCEFEKQCIPYGFRKHVTLYQERRGEYDLYCDLDGALKEQKADWRNCQNSYECESNLCSGGECTGINQMIKNTKTYKVIGIKIICRILHLISNENYNTCVANLLAGETPPTIEPPEIVPIPVGGGSGGSN